MCLGKCPVTGGKVGENRWCLVRNYLKKRLVEGEITSHPNTSVRTALKTVYRCIPQAP